MMRNEWLFPNRATPPGSSAYYSVRFAPLRLRHDLAAVLAWRHEVRAVLDEVSDPGVARLKLNWWIDEIERTLENEPRHPLSHALQPVISSHKLPAAPFRQIAAAVEDEVLRQHAADASAFEAACERDQGALCELMARCHGVHEARTLATARRLGGFCGRVYLIRDSGALVRKNRGIFHQAMLREHGLTAAALAGRGHRERLPGLLAAAAQEARAAVPPPDDFARLPTCLRVRGVILRALLEELDQSRFDLADQYIGLTPLRKLWLAWRESRRKQETH
jgi:phytoene synthase